MAVVKSSQEMDYAIKPEALTPSIPTSEWPLLLKDYDKCTLPKKRKKGTNADFVSGYSAGPNRPLHTNPCRFFASQA
jgi:hypothetical protein